MIKTILFVFALIFIRCTEDKITNTDNVKSLRVDFQYGYVNSLTKLYIDNQNVFEDTLSTNNVISLAKHKYFNVSNGVHTIKCSIDNSEADTIINISDSLVVGISKNNETDKVKYIIYQAGNFPLYL